MINASKSIKTKIILSGIWVLIGCSLALGGAIFEDPQEFHFSYFLAGSFMFCSPPLLYWLVLLFKIWVRGAIQLTTRKETLNIFIGAFVVSLFFSLFWNLFVLLDTPLIWSFLPPVWQVWQHPELAKFQVPFSILMDVTERSMAHNYGKQWSSFINVLDALWRYLIFAVVYASVCLFILCSKRRYQTKRQLPKTTPIMWWQIPRSFIVLTLCLWGLHAVISILSVLIYLDHKPLFTLSGWSSIQLYVEWFLAGILYLLGFLKFI